MTESWNFERRRDTCSQFLIGVSAITKGLPDRDTSLEAVRTRMRLSPEEARFAARRLSDDKLIAFEAGGAVRSNAQGIKRAEELVQTLKTKLESFTEVTKLLRNGGPPIGVVAAVIRADGSPLPCGGPEEDGPDVSYRLALINDVVTLECQRGTEGEFELAGFER